MDTLKIHRSIFLGVFLIAFCTLMYELLLTRIFSVTMYYHFSFMALSIAMFGISIGGMLVFVYKNWFEKQNVFIVCSLCSMAFALTTVLAVLISLACGINALYWSAVIGYTVAILALAYQEKKGNC